MKKYLLALLSVWLAIPFVSVEAAEIHQTSIPSIYAPGSAGGDDVWVQTVDPRTGTIQLFSGSVATPTGNNVAAPRHPTLLVGQVTAGENSSATGASGWGTAAGHFEIRHVTNNAICPTSGYCVSSAIFVRAVMDVTDPDTQTAGGSFHGIRVNTAVGGGSLYGILVDVNDNGLGGINVAATFEINAFTPNRTAGFTRGLMIGNNPWCGTTQPSPLCDPLKSDSEYTNEKESSISTSGFGTLFYAYSSTDCSNGTAGTTVDCAPYIGLDFSAVTFKTGWLKLPAPSRKQFITISTSGIAETGDDPAQISLSGTAGAGFISLPEQSSQPSTPTNAIRLYSDSGNRLGQLSETGFALLHEISALTANRVITWQNLAGTPALTGNALSVFAATTSAQLAGVISDETGSNKLVFSDSPTLVTPVLGVATGTSFQGIIGNITPAAGTFTTVVAGTNFASTGLGSIATPSYQISAGDGMYSAGVSNLNWTVGGAQRMALTGGFFSLYVGGSTNTSWSTPLLTIPASSNTVPITISGYSVTGSGTSNLISASGIVNQTSGSAFDVIKIAITDTAHVTGGKLLNIYGGSAGTTSVYSVGYLGDSIFNANATAPPAIITGSQIQVAQADAVGPGVEAVGYAAAAFFAGRRSGGTAASPAATANAVSIVALRAYGWDTAWTTTARGTFDIASAELWASGATGTIARIFTTPIGSTTQAVALTIGADKSLLATGKIRTNGTAPTVGGSCGTSPSIAGTENSFKVTTGTVAPTSCTVTFAVAWPSAPSCVGVNETTANLLRSISTTTTVILSGTMVASDVLAAICVGGS